MDAQSQFVARHIRVTIPSSKTLNDAESKYTSFDVVVKTPFMTWSLERRYKTFDALNVQMIQMCTKGLQLPDFPGKKVIGVFQQSFVKERREALESYLQAMLYSVPNILAYQPVIDFLNPDSGAPGIDFQIQMINMKDQLNQCESSYLHLQEHVKRMDQEAKKSKSIIDLLIARVNLLERVGGSNSNNFGSDGSSSNHGGSSVSSPPPGLGQSEYEYADIYIYIHIHISMYTYLCSYMYI